MATSGQAIRLSARLVSRHAGQRVTRRGFYSSTQHRAAQNYTMPALSPTMTEGNIAGWHVKEGDSFAAGDVLLEIETDKATMDVEAQDDGILMKITSPDGSKGVKVGHRIAVTAEPGDDIQSLELPADDSAATAKEAAPAKEDESKAKPEPKQESASKSQSSDKTEEKPASRKDASTGPQGGKPHKPKYPLYPSVEAMLHQNGLSEADAANITASGPGGRLLKGDVLAYLGKINKEYPVQASARLEKLSHLDLSNIQLAAKPAPKPAQPAAAAAPDPKLPQDTEIAVPISLAAVIATQKRVQDTLGIFLPLSTFIARASELANYSLPISKSRKPTADDLFNSVLGLDKVATSSRGSFFPQVTGLAPASLPAPARRKADIIDILMPKAAKSSRPRQVNGVVPGISVSENVFSVTASAGEEKRAVEYLEKMKLVLEKESGRLVL